MALVSSVLGHLQQYLVKIAGPLVLIALLLTASCSQPQALETSSISETKPSSIPRPTIKQVSPPSLLGELTSWMDIYEPQVYIRQPQAEQIFDTTTVSVVLQVQDLPIYKDETWNMGPHVKLLLDNQPCGSVYDIEEPIVLENLTPGTHTIRAFAVRPWDESFKNAGAYDQVTFHVFANTGENVPSIEQPLLTYGAPVGTYGAEPVLLDFYLTNAPLHQVAQDNPAISDWQIRYTINGESLTLKNWETAYVEGLKPGQNWVQLTLIDDQGDPIQGVFNNTVRLINYEPILDDGLAKIVRGELTLEDVGSIVDPTYEPPVPETPEAAEQPLPGKNDEEEIDEQEKVLEPDTSTSKTVEPVEPEAIETIDNAEPVERQLPEDIEDINKSPEQASSAQASDDSAVETDDFQSVPTPKSLQTEQLETKRFETPDSPADDNAMEAVSVEPLSEEEPRPVEEVKPDSDIPDSFESEFTSNPAKTVEAESVPSSDSVVETEDEPMIQPSEEDASKEPNTDKDTASKRRYFQRLYDYRERSMKIYGRNR